MRFGVAFVIIISSIVCSCQGRKGFCVRVRGCNVLQGSASHSRSRTDEAGLQHPPGLSGLVNHTIIDTTVDQKMERLEAKILTLESQLQTRDQRVTSMAGLEAKLSTLDTRLETLSQTVTSLKDRLDDLPIENSANWYEAGNGYLYKVFYFPMPYSEARSKCANQGGLIASVGIRDRNFTKKILNAMETDGWLWLGATDQEREGTWVWEDGQVSSGSDITWKGGEPNNVNGGENCASYSKKGRRWIANDVECSTLLRVVCEKKAKA